MEKIFKLQQNGTTVATEIRAGLTTFVAMAYIISLNPVFLSATGMSSAGVLAATCLSAAIGTILSAVLSNKPFAMASGMGMNAYFTYTLCFGYGYTWQQALTLTFISGGVFLVVALLAGKKAVTFIPENLRHAITAGVGLFILLIGMLDAGIVQMTAGFPELGDLRSLPVITSLIGLLAVVVLTVLKVKGSLILGMLITAAFSLATGQTALPESFFALPTALKDVCFRLDFAGLFGSGSLAALIAVILSMSIVDMFDTLGFLIGTVSKTNEGNGGDTEKLDRVLVADAAGTMLGALCGTSTVTCYAESASGIEAGGRTGLTALTTGVMFLACMFIAPLAALIPAPATSAALIYVGVLMLGGLKNIAFDDISQMLPVSLMLISMPISGSIGHGIGLGLISFSAIKILTGKAKEVSWLTYAISVLFLVKFFLVA